MNQPSRFYMELESPIDEDIAVNRRLWQDFKTRYSCRNYSHKEFRWLESLGINPENHLEATTAIDQIEWFIKDRTNLKMAVDQSILDDETYDRVPYDLPGGKQFRVHQNDRLTSHFVEWYQRKCQLINDDIRQYSFESFERGDHVEFRMDDSENILNYQGRQQGAICHSKAALKKFAKSKYKDDPTLSYASVWACVFDSLIDIEQEHGRMFISVTDNGAQCLRDKTNAKGSHKTITYSSFEKYVAEVKKELGLAGK